jgi:hypothetical protein
MPVILAMAENINRKPEVLACMAKSKTLSQKQPE